MIKNIINQVVEKYPEILPMLSAKAKNFLSAQKTYEVMLDEVTNLIEDAYSGTLSTPDFVRDMTDILRNQIVNAFHNAWIDSDYGGEGFYIAFPDYLQSAQDDYISQNTETQYAYQLYNDIVKARIENNPVSGLVVRAPLWANKWNDAYNAAMLLIQSQGGGNLIWVVGPTEKSCTTCQSLNGIIASADEWEQSPYKPQGKELDCGGWRCQCSLQPTNEKRTRGRQRRMGI